MVTCVGGQLFEDYVLFVISSLASARDTVCGKTTLEFYVLKRLFDKVSLPGGYTFNREHDNDRSSYSVRVVSTHEYVTLKDDVPYSPMRLNGTKDKTGVMLTPVQRHLESIYSEKLGSSKTNRGFAAWIRIAGSHELFPCLQDTIGAVSLCPSRYCSADGSNVVMMDEHEIASVVHIGLRMEFKLAARLELNLIISQAPRNTVFRVVQVLFYATDIQ